jgi:hypothetical protein
MPYFSTELRLFSIGCTKRHFVVETTSEHVEYGDMREIFYVVFFNIFKYV